MMLHQNDWTNETENRVSKVWMYHHARGAYEAICAVYPEQRGQWDLSAKQAPKKAPPPKVTSVQREQQKKAIQQIKQQPQLVQKPTKNDQYNLF